MPTSRKSSQLPSGRVLSSNLHANVATVDHWGTFDETLEMDSHSSAFDGNLRRSIASALGKVETLSAQDAAALLGLPESEIVGKLKVRVATSKVWNLLYETLEIDAQSSMFDPELRKEIKVAYDGIVDIETFKNSRAVANRLAEFQRSQNSRENLKEEFKQIIEKKGHAVLGVGGDRSRGIPQFVYTIGLSLQGLPELILPFVNLEAGKTILNGIVSEMKAGKKFEAGTVQSEIFRGLPCYLLGIDQAEVAETMPWIAYVIGKEDVSAIHLTLPDKDGKMPWEPNCGNPGMQQFAMYKNEPAFPTPPSRPSLGR